MFDIIHPVTNKIVNVILIIMIDIMKDTLLLNDCNEQESLISENVATIRIYLQPYKGNHLTTRHT
jgi:hypothetical protein